MNKTFIWTNKQLEKKFSKNTLDKYGNILSYLYQNGFDINCEDDEVEEQLGMFNFFKSKEDLEELRNLTPKIKSDFTVGKKIFTEEIYDIIKSNTFIREDSDNPTVIKTYVEVNWERISKALERISNLFFCEDSEILGILNTVKNLSDIRERILYIQEKMEKGIKVLSWLKFTELMNILYSLYIQFGKIKTDQHKLTIASNFNDELYGGIGGYNPITGEIKCIIGSAVSDVKSCKAGNKSKIKNMAKAILSETKTDEEDEEISYLQRWFKGSEHNDEFAQQIVVNSLLNGVLILLTLKHNINFLEEERNSRRADDIKQEFLAIMKYCNIEKDYLL